MRKTSYIVLILILALSVTGCGSSQPAPTVIAPGPEKATPTPTLVAAQPHVTPTIYTSECAGLVAELEVQVLVGPAEAVGLEPFSIGYIPFAVTVDQEPYLLQGGGQLEYAEILIEEWGSYEVNLVMDATITGECVDTGGAGELHMVVEMSGMQTVVVTADNFYGEYPWSGTTPFDLIFPLVEGASMEGEGWAFTLHMLVE